MSKVVTAGVLANERLTPQVFRLKADCGKDYPPPLPGQFVNIYLNDAARLLPRPISVCDWENNTLTLTIAVAGAGTARLSRLSAGDTLRVSTPLGRGFAMDINRPAVLVGGGVGAAPLVYVQRRLPNALAVLGFASRPFLSEAFPNAAVATDDGSRGFHGNAVDLLAQTPLPDDALLYACGPKPMLKALTVLAAARGLDAQVSLEERMGCGYGACVGCTCQTTPGAKKVCEDGPVFNASEVKWND